MATTATRSIPHNLVNPAPVQSPVQELTASGAITIPAGFVQLNLGSAIAATLALPNANGLRLTITSKTAQAHTVTVASGIGGAGATDDVLTWGGAADDGITLFSAGGFWWVEPGTNLNVTIA